MSDPLLAATGLVKTFPGVRAVDGVSLTADAGRIQAIVGPNGSGKSTVLDLLAGVHEPTAGRIRLDGVDVTDEPLWTVAARGVVKSFQQSNVFDHLAAADNVRVARWLARGDAEYWTDLERAVGPVEPYLERVGLAGKREAMARDLSYGQRRLLEFAMVLATEPRVVLLDEPTAGLSEDNRERVERIVESMADGRAVVLVEHELDTVARLADDVSLCHDGSFVATGTYEDLRADPRARRLYFGGEASV